MEAQEDIRMSRAHKRADKAAADLEVADDVAPPLGHAMGFRHENGLFEGKGRFRQEAGQEENPLSTYSAENDLLHEPSLFVTSMDDLSLPHAPHGIPPAGRNRETVRGCIPEFLT